jgi:hypothetical protein
MRGSAFGADPGGGHDNDLNAAALPLLYPRGSVSSNAATAQMPATRGAVGPARFYVATLASEYRSGPSHNQFAA